MIDDEPTIIYSPLRQRISSDSTHIDVEIYRGENEAFWLLEVIDEEGASTVYDDRFASDQAALYEVMDAIQKYGIRVYLEEGFPETLH